MAFNEALGVRASARYHLARTMLAATTHVKPLALFTEALDLARQAGHVVLEAHCLECLADIARHQGRNEEGLQRVNEALDLFHRLGDRTGEGIARHCRGLILAQMGDQHQAEALADLRQSVRLAFDLGHAREVASALRSLAPVLLPDARLFPASGQNRPQEPGSGPLTRNEGPFACSAACLQTAIDLHDRLGFPAWKKAYRDLDRLRASAAQAGLAWAEVEQSVAADRLALLQEATGLGSESWRRWLSGAEEVLADSVSP